MDDVDDFFSSYYGEVVNSDRLLNRLIKNYPRRVAPRLERLYDWRLALVGIPRRLQRAAARLPETRKILILGVEVPARPEFMERVRSTLPRSRHDVTFSTIDVGGRGRFENINMLLKRHNLVDISWLIVTDDDVALVSDFLDQFVFLLERFDFKIAQPAHNLVSNLTYEVTGRHWGTVARRTGFVELGPLVAFHRDTFSELLPFPEGGMGWGVDAHWALLAKQRGWRMGIVDALPLRHLRPVGGGYSRDNARALAREFLKAHGGLSRREALQTIESFRSL